LLSALNWRYAVRQFDPSRKIPPELWAALEEALLLTPSSYGLQPWRFVVVTDPEKKAALRVASYNQAQVSDCSHFVVFTVRRELLGSDYIEEHLARSSEVLGKPLDAFEKYGKMLHGALEKAHASGHLDAWQSHQIYIALGNFLTSAALLGIDACPMEGFSNAQVDDILGLADSDYCSEVCCAAGYRAASDKYATQPKVRLPRESVFTHL